VKQLGFACCQVVQKPVALSFHVPVFLEPDCARGSRVILPSGVNVIVNLVPPGVEAVKDWPLKKVALMSLGTICSAAKAALPMRSEDTTVNGPARINSEAPITAKTMRTTRAMVNIIGTSKCFAIPIADRACQERVQGRPIEGGPHILSARKSAYVRDPLLGPRFCRSNRLRRQLEHCRFLTLKHLSEQQGLPVRKF